MGFCDWCHETHTTAHTAIYHDSALSKRERNTIESISKKGLNKNLIFRNSLFLSTYIGETIRFGNFEIETIPGSGSWHGSNQPPYSYIGKIFSKIVMLTKIKM